MQARCPRCASVFTTDRSGLQFCPNCGQQVDVPSFPGAPPESSGAGWGGPSGPGGPGSMGPGPALREDTPWERRATVGWAKGLLETWKQTVFSPMHFWASVKPDGSWTDAVLYGWILATVGILVAAPLNALGMGRFALHSTLDQMANMPPAFRSFYRSFATGGGSFAGILLYPIGIIIYSAILHLFCMLFGVAKHGYYATLRVMAYSSALAIFSGIPGIGLLTGLYAVVLEILGLAAVQESTVGRAAAAVLAPLVFCCCCAGLIGASLLGTGAFAILKQLQTQ